MVEGAPKMQNVVDNHKNVLYNEKKDHSQNFTELSKCGVKRIM